MKVEPLTATIGAEIDGVDLAGPLTDDAIAELRAALLEWKVIFFRDQHDLDRARHIEFGRRFGELEVHPLTPSTQKEPEIFVLPSEGKMRAPDVWHSDVTWRFRSEEHTSELQSHVNLVCRLLLEKKKK